MSLGCSGSVRRCGSNLERNTFQAHYDNGILNVAAAGNDGNTQRSWPASYPSVISVAAVDSNEVVASFSQQNSDVELAAPGVAVRSTLPRGTGKEESLAVGSTGYEAIALDGSPDDDGSGPLVNCGLGTSDCPGGGGQVCLIQRGNISFADKVLACQAGGGAAAVIYNNEPGLFSGTLSTTVTNIPSVGISKADGEALAASGGNATVSVAVGDYGYLDGTSMATPHVAGVAALIWTYNGSYTAAQIRQALQTYAKDLGPAGKDDAYGYGLVQASAASFCLANPSDALCTGDGGGGGGGGGGDTGGGGGGSCELGQAGDACSSDAECCSNSCKGKPGSKTCK
jgi:subtilisin family serine protease